MKDYTKVLFLDAETVPIVESFDQLDERLQNLFKKKFDKQFNDFVKSSHYGEDESEIDLWNDFWLKTASFHAEFAKVVCISIGAFVRQGDKNTGQQKFFVKALTPPSEETILKELATIINTQLPFKLCTHNGKNFDIPFLCRRMIMLGIQIPQIMNTMGKKPWEISHDDTMEMWGFGEWGKKVTLDLLAASLGIPSPKDQMDGGQVSHFFYEYDRASPEIQSPARVTGLQLIGQYCNKDVVTLAKCYVRLMGETEEVQTL